MPLVSSLLFSLKVTALRYLLGNTFSKTLVSMYHILFVCVHACMYALVYVSVHGPWLVGRLLGILLSPTCFMWVQGIWTQVLMLAQQSLYPPSHLTSHLATPLPPQTCSWRQMLVSSILQAKNSFLGWSLPLLDNQLPKILVWEKIKRKCAFLSQSYPISYFGILIFHVPSNRLVFALYFHFYITILISKNFWWTSSQYYLKYALYFYLIKINVTYYHAKIYNSLKFIKITVNYSQCSLKEEIRDIVYLKNAFHRQAKTSTLSLIYVTRSSESTMDVLSKNFFPECITVFQSAAIIHTPKLSLCQS